MVGGKSGYLLEIGEQRYWIEPQVDLGPEQGVVYPCRPDFVIRPARSQSSRKPFAVFCDGWEYHQRSTREDARKRSALVASGGYWVWSVTWEDVKAAMDGKLPTELTATLDPMCRIPVGGLPAPLRAMNEETVWSEHAVAALLRWLSKPPGTNGDQYASRVSQHGTSTAFRMMPNPADPLLADARARLNGFWRRVVDHPCQEPPRAASCGNTNEEAVTLRYWWPSEALAPTAGALPPSPGFLVFDDSQLEVDLDRHLAWRRWLWLFNVFQTLPGLVLATVPGIEGGDHAALAFAAGNRLGGGPADQAEGAAWQGVLDQVMAILVPALRSLMESGVALPDEVGYELASDTGVQAEAELAWLAQKVVVLVPEAADAAQVWRQAGWTAIVAEDGWPEQLSAALSVTSTSAANEQGGVQ
jgi:DEAD/DEAH box helicase domain-containing protein